MILELCKGLHCVDLDESFPTHIYLQIFVSIQPRTSPVKSPRSRRARTWEKASARSRGFFLLLAADSADRQEALVAARPHGPGLPVVEERQHGLDAPERRHVLFFENFKNFQKKFKNFFEIKKKNSKKIQKKSKISKIFRRGAVQKLGVLVDLAKCCALRISLQNLASIQPRTSPGNFASFRQIFEILAKLSTSSPTVSKIFRRGAVQKLGVRVDLGKCYTLRILLQNLASTQPRTGPGKIASFRQIFGNFGDAVDFFADRLEKFSTRGGAKAGGAGRSGQMLHVAYFVAKFGLDPAENEPRQVWQILADFRH